MKTGKINPSIFRAYDIRGVYGTDITEEIMEMIGNAFASGFVKGCCVVGSDGRNSGPGLKKAFIRGALKAGKSVTDVGVVPRGACLFHAWKLGIKSAYVTASHLPKEWNGVKFSYENGVEFFEDDNSKIGKVVLSGKLNTAAKGGDVKSENPIKKYRRYIISKIRRADKPLKVIIDSGNGVAGLAAPQLFRELGFSVKTLFEKVDGNFPNRLSEIEEKTLSGLRNNVHGNDMGIAFDGDADRVVLMDEKGRLLGPETTSYIILQELVKHEKGPIIANVECLKIMDDIAKKYGRKLFRVRVGNSFLVQAVEEHGACFGVERSGHFCMPSIIPVDDGLAVSLYAASVISRSGKKLSEIVDEVPQYPFKRHKVDCPDEVKFGVVDSLKKKLSDEYENVNTIDGVRVDFDYGWILIRASNTEPIIRLSVEADDEKKINELGEKFLAVLKEEIKDCMNSRKKNKN